MRRQAGFTLLEVLVAIAILGLGLTVILSSQTGLFASASRGEHLTAASNLVRCKMSEIELTLEQKGFQQLTDESDEGPCCDDESEGYACSWKIERVELPPLPDPSLDPSAAPSSSAGGLALSGGLASQGLNGPGGLGALGGLGGPPGAAPGGLGAGGPLGALAALSSGQGFGSAGSGNKAASPAEMLGQISSGTGGIETMVMSLVYPTLKPMLEASIRRVTVKVSWHEGNRGRDLEVTQFLTRPQEGQLGTADMLGLPQDAAALGAAFGAPGTTPGSTTPTTPTTPGGTK